ncbi:substrate-binding domain-containing protein, partial [Streptomyces caeruleatus]
IEFPVYISPISVVYNVEGVDNLNLDAETLAKIFSGEITNWNDEAIAALNEGVTLPDATITAVHRSDDSGTTKNFTDYL